MRARQRLAQEAITLREKAIKSMLQPCKSGATYGDGGVGVASVGCGGELTYDMADDDVHRSVYRP